MSFVGETTSVVKLVIVHFHLRPGGIRRILELATPYLVRAAPQPVTQVVLATGQRADDEWHEHFARQLPGVPVEVRVSPAFNYLSEQRGPAARITRRIRCALDNLFARCEAGNCLVWAHNLGVARNLLLARELATACAARAIPLVTHHHDWWFDNRWSRWPEMRRFGFRTLTAPARAVFPKAGRVLHAAINQADANVLARHFGDAAFWLPNLTEPASPPPTARVRAARRWLAGKLADAESPVWLLPCRTLRRKNIAEALLLTRWLRPEAWLVVTGAASSADETDYYRALERSARKHHWRLRLGVLGGHEPGKPTVPDLLAASETALLTSIQEGFGLPYLEAAAAQRPLLARRLPNIAPDLHQFGFRFPQAYDDLLIDPTLFDWQAEQARQERLFHDWCARMPAAVRKIVPAVPILSSARPGPIAFSRLTFTAQLEVLAQPLRESWAACARLNPFLKTWQRRATTGRLSVTPWPRAAKGWLGGEAYARKFFAALQARAAGRAASFSPVRIQADFIAQKLARQNLYPLLWNTRT